MITWGQILQIPSGLLGSLNWELGERLSRVIVSTWLHGHGVWGGGTDGDVAQ